MSQTNFFECQEPRTTAIPEGEEMCAFFSRQIMPRHPVDQVFLVCAIQNLRFEDYNPPDYVFENGRQRAVPVPREETAPARRSTAGRGRRPTSTTSSREGARQNLSTQIPRIDEARRHTGTGRRQASTTSSSNGTRQFQATSSRNGTRRHGTSATLSRNGRRPNQATSSTEQTLETSGVRRSRTAREIMDELVRNVMRHAQQQEPIVSRRSTRAAAVAARNRLSNTRN